jgi:hypothetical protein
MSLGHNHEIWNAGRLVRGIPEDEIGVDQLGEDVQEDHFREEVDMLANEVNPDLLRGQSQEAPLTPRRGHIPGAFDKYIWSDSEPEDEDEPERTSKSQNRDLSPSLPHL